MGKSPMGDFATNLLEGFAKAANLSESVDNTTPVLSPGRSRLRRWPWPCAGGRGGPLAQGVPRAVPASPHLGDRHVLVREGLPESVRI